MSKILTVLLVLVFAAGSAQAVISMEWVLVNDPGGDTPAGYTAWDLMVTTATNLALQEFIITAANPGDIYQDTGLGSNPYTEPNPAGFPGTPSLEFDTYVTLGAWSYASPTNIAGAAVDIQGLPARTETFDDQLLDIAWAPIGGNNSGPGTFQVARVTTKDGTYNSTIWEYWGKETGQVDATTASGAIPEPTTLLLLVGPALAVLRRRR